MKRSFVLILAVVFIFPFVARSQNEGIKPVANPQEPVKTSMHSRTTQQMALMQEQGTSGGDASPAGMASTSGGMYLEPGWAPGRVLLSDGSVMENIRLRYDIYHQQIQFIKEKDTLAFSKPEEVKYFIFDGRNFIYSEFQKEDVTAKGYFEILTEGECKLFLHRSIKYHADPESDPNLKEEVYIRESEYFISRNDDVARPVRACRKGVLCVFKDKEEQVDEFMKVNNLKMKTCDEFIQVVQYYNSLQ
ncbi:MAG: hypothetical protein MUC31_00625 [Bacteroidales bacterium]|jgi:hypothetical protein|nr:hypothetical protein [Bacteroidales bacterium]